MPGAEDSACKGCVGASRIAHATVVLYCLQAQLAFDYTTYTAVDHGLCTDDAASKQRQLSCVCHLPTRQHLRGEGGGNQPQRPTPSVWRGREAALVGRGLGSTGLNIPHSTGVKDLLHCTHVQLLQQGPLQTQSNSSTVCSVTWLIMLRCVWQNQTWLGICSTLAVRWSSSC